MNSCLHSELKIRLSLRRRLAAVAAIFAIVIASLVFASAPAAAANGTAMTCSTRSLASLPVRSSGRSVDVMSLTAQGVPCSKALELAKRVAADLAHGRSISLPGLVGLSTVSTSACAGCRPSTHVSLAFAHGAVNIAFKGVGGASSLGGGPFAMPSFPQLPVPTTPFPVPPSPTTTV